MSCIQLEGKVCYTTLNSILSSSILGKLFILLLDRNISEES